MSEGPTGKFCPLIRKECIRDRCEWWRGGREQFAKCIIHDIDSIGFKLFKIQQALEGKSGAPGGGARNYGGNPGARAQQRRPRDEDFDELDNPF